MFYKVNCFLFMINSDEMEENIIFQLLNSIERHAFHSAIVSSLVRLTTLVKLLLNGNVSIFNEINEK